MSCDPPKAETQSHDGSVCMYAMIMVCHGHHQQKPPANVSINVYRSGSGSVMGAKAWWMNGWIHGARAIDSSFFFKLARLKQGPYSMTISIKIYKNPIPSVHTKATAHILKNDPYGRSLGKFRKKTPLGFC